MQTEILKLSGLTTEAQASSATQALKKISGVSEVSISVAGGRATVQFDGERTSRQEMITVLASAGYALDTKQAATSCCGGCGGA